MDHLAAAAPYQATIASPVGPLRLVACTDALTRVEFLPAKAALAAAHDPVCREAAAQLGAYFEDPAAAFDIPLAPRGTPFQQCVWGALREIPAGEMSTYGLVAQRVSGVARAVGSACRSNPIAILIPCHRVVAANGVGGFMGHVQGAPLQTKRWLLTHELWAAHGIGVREHG